MAAGVSGVRSARAQRANASSEHTTAADLILPRRESDDADLVNCNVFMALRLSFWSGGFRLLVFTSVWEKPVVIRSPQNSPRGDFRDSSRDTWPRSAGVWIGVLC